MEKIMKELWNKFTAWLSGWPESKESKKEKEQIYLFAEEEELKKKVKKVKGLNPKKKKGNKK